MIPNKKWIMQRLASIPTIAMRAEQISEYPNATLYDSWSWKFISRDPWIYVPISGEYKTYVTTYSFLLKARWNPQGHFSLRNDPRDQSSLEIFPFVRIDFRRSLD